MNSAGYYFNLFTSLTVVVLGRRQGTGLEVNSTCYMDGIVEFSWRSFINVDGLQIDYNCTGNTEKNVRFLN